jgi:hypothetical protein
MKTYQRGEVSGVAIGVLSLFSVIGLVIALMVGIPLWKVWQQGLSGEASLQRAKQEKLIMIETAQAEEESAKYIANAIAIVGQATKDFPEYRQQQFIAAFSEAVQNKAIDQIIYVPTEANIPVTEAIRLSKAD